LKASCQLVSVVAVVFTFAACRADEAPDSRSAEELALELVQLTNTPEVQDRLLDLQAPIMVDALRRLLGNQLSENGVAEFTKRWRVAMQPVFGELNQAVVPVYAEHFTRDELRQLIEIQQLPEDREATVADYPVLKKARAGVMRDVIQESAEIGMQFGAERGRQVALRVVDAMHEDGYRLLAR